MRISLNCTPTDHIEAGPTKRALVNMFPGNTDREQTRLRLFVSL
jgi:hypothetical protein